MGCYGGLSKADSGVWAHILFQIATVPNLFSFFLHKVFLIRFLKKNTRSGDDVPPGISSSFVLKQGFTSFPFPVSLFLFFLLLQRPGKYE